MTPDFMQKLEAAAARRPFQIYGDGRIRQCETDLCPLEAAYGWGYGEAEHRAKDWQRDVMEAADFDDNRPSERKEIRDTLLELAGL